MWKDSFCIGVEVIDRQHKELFDKTEELLSEVRNNGMKYKDKCISTILFLKDYAVKHFADEEAYQISINYKDYDAHKKLHDKFVQTVLKHEKKMEASNFAESDVREFVDALVAWLLYHVVDADKKIK
ncbi:MAG: hemerythrin family protein [Oscillospiraceae bacterium]|nr:hemerythrin family protein [Oscillospiraceae bacterium]